MNIEMAYLLGMICGNGQIQRTSTTTIVSIDIPHKKLQTDEIHDVQLYVKASIADIRAILEPLVGAGLAFIQSKSLTTLSFYKPNSDYLIREINKFIGNAASHHDINIHKHIFDSTLDERKQFIKGFADVTAYIRRSNAYFKKFEHRVYFEIPHNWCMVIDICNLLKSVDIPVQTIDWAHPNIRDGHLRAYNEGKPHFWKKEHQIKVWANEFMPIGFGIMHKQQALEMFSEELIVGYRELKKDPNTTTHKYYWDSKKKACKIKKVHPAENDEFIPNAIRGKHFDSWSEIAKELGYVK